MEVVLHMPNHSTSRTFAPIVTGGLLLLAAAAPAVAAEAPDRSLWSPGQPVAGWKELPRLPGVRFEVIQPMDPEKDGYRWLHGVALAWHKGQLYASFGHNQGRENTAGEQARGRISRDDGRTWGDIFTMEAGAGDIGVSHGVFLSHQGRLWAFHGAFSHQRQVVHTRAYLLNESTGAWDPQGTLIGDSFWPLQEPIRMADGNWIMAGTRLLGQTKPYRNPPAVAISHGDDLRKWDVVSIELGDTATDDVWGESTVIVRGSHVTNIARYGGEAVALVSRSTDYGRTWTKAERSDLPMVTSKPYAGTLSTGQHYLIATTTADSRRRRSPLTIALTRPGETQFSRIFVIRDAVQDGKGDSDPAARLSYPYAIEHRGHLYVGYSNAGSRGGNRNSAELAIIPLESLTVP